MEDLATKWKAKIAPMQGAQWPMSYRRRFIPAEINALRAGLWPQDTDDRWIIWLDEGVLRLWRSRTQTCIYELPVTVWDDGSGESRIAMVLDAKAFYHRCPTEEGELQRLAGVLSLILNREMVGA